MGCGSDMATDDTSASFIVTASCFTVTASTAGSDTGTVVTGLTAGGGISILISGLISGTEAGTGAGVGAGGSTGFAVKLHTTYLYTSKW